MGLRGPQPKPTQLKVIEGNRGKQKLPENEVAPPVSSICPEPPDWLAPAAKEFWGRNAMTLYSCGLLTDADLESFALLSDVYGRLRDYMGDVDREGRCVNKAVGRAGRQRDDEPAPAPIIQRVPHFATKEANDLRAQFIRLSAAFGMTPSSRVGLSNSGSKKTAAERVKESLG